jgi:hypothetical protein
VGLQTLSDISQILSLVLAVGMLPPVQRWMGVFARASKKILITPIGEAIFLPSDSRKKPRPYHSVLTDSPASGFPKKFFALV